MPRGRPRKVNSDDMPLNKKFPGAASRVASLKAKAILADISDNRPLHRKYGGGKRRLKYSGPGAGRIGVKSYQRKGRHVRHHWRHGNARRARPKIAGGVATNSRHEQLGRHIYKNLRRKDAGRKRKYKPIDHGFKS